MVLNVIFKNVPDKNIQALSKGTIFILIWKCKFNELCFYAFVDFILNVFNNDYVTVYNCGVEFALHDSRGHF